MNELPKQAAELLADARSRHSASAQELERGLSRLHAQLEFSDVGADFGGEDVATQAEPWSSAHGFFASKLVKVTLSALAISGGIGLTYLAYPSPTPSTSLPAAQPADGEPAPTAAAQPALSATAVISDRDEPSANRLPAEADSPMLPRGKADLQRPAQSGSGMPSARSLRSPRAAPDHARTASARAAATLAQAEASTADERNADERNTDERNADERNADEREEPRTQAPARDAVPVAQSALAELDLIDEALTRLRKREPTTALALLDDHARRYPAGKLSVERRGLHVVALCASGQFSEGRAEQAAFLARDGNAPIAERVRRACKEQDR